MMRRGFHGQVIRKKIKRFEVDVDDDRGFFKRKKEQL